VYDQYEMDVFAVDETTSEDTPDTVSLLILCSFVASILFTLFSDF